MAIRTLIGSTRREYLDHIFIFGKRHLRHILRADPSIMNERGRLKECPGLDGLIAIGAIGTARMLIGMIFAQAGLCAVLGTGLGLGLCGIVGQMVSSAEYPSRMMWFTPLPGVVMVVLVSLLAAAISARPLLRLQPTLAFTGR